MTGAVEGEAERRGAVRRMADGRCGPAEEADRERVDRVRALLGDDQRPAVGSGGDLRGPRACERLYGARDGTQQTAPADAEPATLPPLPAFRA